MITMHLKSKQPEKYDGSRDFQKIDNWIASMDSYFAITEAQPSLIYHYLNTIFINEAATWFRYTYGKMDPSTVTWMTIRTALLNYFVRSNHTRRLRDQWAGARQISTVTEYHAYLAQLAMQIENISEEEFSNKFIRELKSNTRTKLKFRDPQIIEQTVKWANTLNARYYRKQNSQQYYNTFSSNQVYQEDNRGESMQIDTLQAINKTSAAIQIDAFKTKPRQFKLNKLTEKDRNHLRSIGACFRCRQKGHMAHECPSKTDNNSKNSKCQ